MLQAQDVTPPAIVAPAPANTPAMGSSDLTSVDPATRDVTLQLVAQSPTQVPATWPTQSQPTAAAQPQPAVDPQQAANDRFLRSDPQRFPSNNPQPGDAGFNPSGVNLINRGNILREALQNPSATQRNFDPGMFHPRLAEGAAGNVADAQLRITANDLYRQMERNSFHQGHEKLSVYQMMNMMGHHNQAAMSPHATKVIAEELGRQVQANWVEMFPGQNAPVDPMTCLRAYVDQVAQDPAAMREFLGIGSSRPFDAAHVAGEIKSLIDARVNGQDLSQLQTRYLELFNRPIRDQEVRALGSELARLGVNEDSLRMIDPNNRLFVLTSLYGTEIARVHGFHAGLERNQPELVERSARAIPETGAERFRSAYQEYRGASPEFELNASRIDKSSDTFVDAALAVQGVNVWDRANTFANAFKTQDAVTLQVETRRLPDNDPVIAMQIREKLAAEHGIDPIEQVSTRVADPNARRELLSPWLAPEAQQVERVLSSIGQRRAGEPVSEYSSAMNQGMGELRQLLSNPATADVIRSKVDNFDARLEENLQLVVQSTDIAQGVPPAEARTLRIEAAATANAVRHGIPVEGTRAAMIAYDSALTSASYTDLRDVMRQIPPDLRGLMADSFQQYVDRSMSFENRVNGALQPDDARRIMALQRGLDVDTLVAGLKQDISRVTALNALRDDQLSELAWAYHRETGRPLMLDARAGLPLEQQTALVGTAEQPGIATRLYGREQWSTVSTVAAAMNPAQAPTTPEQREEHELAVMTAIYNVPNANIGTTLEMYDVLQNQKNADGTPQQGVLRSELERLGYTRAVQLIDAKLKNEIAEPETSPSVSGGAANTAAQGAAPVSTTRQMVQAGILRPEVKLREPRLEVVETADQFEKGKVNYFFDGAVTVTLTNPTNEPMPLSAHLYVLDAQGRRYEIDNGVRERWEGTVPGGASQEVTLQFKDNGAATPSGTIVVQVVAADGKVYEQPVPVTTTTRGK